jgi:hypothetical protein
LTSSVRIDSKKKENQKGKEVISMEKRWWNGERALRMAGVWAMWGGACWGLGVIFAILGVIGDAINGALGLESTSWFLLAIAMFVASIPEYLGWAVAVYLQAKEAKKKE